MRFFSIIHLLLGLLFLLGSPTLCAQQKKTVLKSSAIPANCTIIEETPEHITVIQQTECPNVSYRNYFSAVRDSCIVDFLLTHMDSSQIYRLFIQPKSAKKSIEKFGLTATQQQFEIDYSLSRFSLEAWLQVMDSSQQKEFFTRFYYPDAERFFKRYQFNYTKLTLFNNKQEVCIYPDTIRPWVNFNEQLKNQDTSLRYYNHEMINMYFWHPAFDFYPMIGLDSLQIDTYRLWLQHQLNAANNGYTYQVSLPDLPTLKRAFNLAYPENAHPTFTLDSLPYSFHALNQQFIDNWTHKVYDKSDRYFPDKKQNNVTVFGFANNYSELIWDENGHLALAGSDVFHIFRSPNLQDEIVLNAFSLQPLGSYFPSAENTFRFVIQIKKN